jgi:hypothetical protein
MRSYIPENLRILVAQNAHFRWEYCHIHQDDQFYTFHVDHIISLKHGGKTEFLNLAYTCSVCNLYKGSDLGTFLPNSKRLIRLFNPRKDSWSAHFSIGYGEIIPKTLIGAATVKVLDINNVDRIILRQALIDEGLYPPADNRNI